MGMHVTMEHQTRSTAEKAVGAEQRCNSDDGRLKLDGGGRYPRRLRWRTQSPTVRTDSNFNASRQQQERSQGWGRGSGKRTSLEITDRMN